MRGWFEFTLVVFIGSPRIVMNTPLPPGPRPR